MQSKSLASSFKTLIRLPQVRQFVGLSRSEIYRRMALRQFPKSVPLGKRAIAAAEGLSLEHVLRVRGEARDGERT